MKTKIFFFVATILFSSNSLAIDKTTIRLGVLAFGTVNWELTVLKNQQSIADNDFVLDIHPLANPQAGEIALQSGDVDMIVSDWIWVSRLRSTGADYTFFPYSATSGALMVPNHSEIKSINDLRDIKLGIAGGELDKNWLLLQALSQQNHQLDLNLSVEKVYGAPPLLNQQILHQRVDAIINYWHFAARLEAKQFKQLINGEEILNQLGIKEQVATLGYVFNRSWGKENKNAVNQFLTATQQAKNQLCESDRTWQLILPLTKTKDVETQTQLRQRYCAGRIKNWGEREQLAAAKIYSLLRQYSNNKLTGHSEKIQPKTFWLME